MAPPKFLIETPVFHLFSYKPTCKPLRDSLAIFIGILRFHPEKISDKCKKHSGMFLYFLIIYNRGFKERLS
jgi:hypothetical protein